MKVIEYRKRAAAVMDENQLQENVVLKAEAYRWLWWHDTDSRRNKAGLPDLILLRPPRLIFAELKIQNGRLRADQKTWLENLYEVPQVETFLWRPSDLLDGTIDRTLQ